MSNLEIFKTPLCFIVTALLIFSFDLRVMCQSEPAVAKLEKSKSKASSTQSIDDEIVSREKQEAEADQKVDEARKKFEANKFREAVDLYMDAYEKFKPLAVSSQYIQRKMKRIDSNMAMVY